MNDYSKNLKTTSFLSTKKVLSVFLLTTVFLIGSPLAYANLGSHQDNNSDESAIIDSKKAEVEWLEPKKYTDVRSGNMSRTKFRKHVMKELDEHLQELAEGLPEGQSLRIKVTDLDLAGRVEPGRFSGLVNTFEEIRILRDIDIPRIDFSYELLDEAGVVVKTEEVELKDMNYLRNVRISRRDQPYAYEKRMLSEWFEDLMKAA